MSIMNPYLIAELAEVRVVETFNLIVILYFTLCVCAFVCVCVHVCEELSVYNEKICDIKCAIKYIYVFEMNCAKKTCL